MNLQYHSSSGHTGSNLSTALYFIWSPEIHTDLLSSTISFGQHAAATPENVRRKCQHILSDSFEASIKFSIISKIFEEELSNHRVLKEYFSFIVFV